MPHIGSGRSTKHALPLVVDIKGDVVTKSFNYGDSDFGLQYLPSEEVVIELAKIDFHR